MYGQVGHYGDVFRISFAYKCETFGCGEVSLFYLAFMSDSLRKNVIVLVIEFF